MSSSLWSMFAEKTRAMAHHALSGIDCLEDWRAARTDLLAELLQALGLDPMPRRCDLKIQEFGQVDGVGFTVRRIGFQILPDCWASAAIFYPDPLPPERCPGILYLCGHAALGLDHYQAHPILWARRGYVCLILETIEQSDNPGEHHGANLGWLPRWISLGYSAASGELWNSIRGLDLLADDPSVDPDRLGATGVSGGGSISFFLAAVDHRVRAVSSLCGVSTPADAVANRHLYGHCDCFYPINYHARDISDYAGLIAPRAALFCFADHDNLFHPEEGRRLVESTRKVYEFYGAAENCRLITCPGGHGDHVEFDEATQVWFDKHVAGRSVPQLLRGGRELSEFETCVFQGVPPFPNHLDLLPSLLSPRGRLPLPRSADEWQAIRDRAVEQLRGLTFVGMPAGWDVPGLKLDGDWRWGETPVREYIGKIDGSDMAMRALFPPNAGEDLVIAIAGAGQTVQHAFAAAASLVDRSVTTFAGFEPRWAAERSMDQDRPQAPLGSELAPIQTSLVRAMALTGWTPVKLIVADLLCLVEALQTRAEFQNLRPVLYGRGDAGVAAIYAAVLDSRIQGVVAEGIVGSHSEGASLPGILRLLDLPQALGLLCPRPVTLVNPVYTSWGWPQRLYERLGAKSALAVTSALTPTAVAAVLESGRIA